MIYLDTAYLVKCYVPEPGSAEVRRLCMTAGHVACCSYGRAELAAAVHRKVREGLLSEGARRIVFRQMGLDDQSRVVYWFPVTEALLGAVARAFETLPAGACVRAGDALHLVCAREQGFADIHSSDRQLLAAAPFFGLVGRNILS
jgi:predicted nucleic acid-binding protein